MANKKFLNPINLVNLSSDPSTASEGDIYYNTTDDVVKVYANGAWIAIGSGGGASTSSVYLVRNNTGSTILKGTLVSASGAEPSGRIDVEPFAVVGGINSELTVMGMATANISNGVNGEVISFGTLTGLDTRGNTASAIAVGDETWAAGDILFAHPTVAGKLTKVRPQHDLAVAFITVRHASTGQIAVRIVPGNNHLEWMHDVLIDTPADNEVLSYDSASGLWKNQAPEVGGSTTVSETAPSSPETGDSWYKNDTGEFYIYDGSFWVEVNGVVDALTSLDDLTDVVISGTPTDGQALIWDTEISKWINETVSGGGSTTVSETAPDSPSTGDSWYKSDTSELYVYDGSYWVEVSNGLSSQTSISETSPLEPSQGNFWYSSLEGILYIYDGSYWVEVNTTVQGPSNIYDLLDVVITMPTDGQALVWDTTTSKWINETVVQDLSGYAPIINPVFTNNIEVDRNINFDVVSGTPGARIGFSRIPGLYDALDIVSTDVLFLQSLGSMNISSESMSMYSSTDLVFNGTNGEYIGFASANNQIATLGDLANLVDSAPSTLNTLNELAEALGDDANFATTITTSLGNKLDSTTAASTYLTQASASSTYATNTNPEFLVVEESLIASSIGMGSGSSGFVSASGYATGNIIFNNSGVFQGGSQVLNIPGEVFFVENGDGIDQIRFTILSSSMIVIEGSYVWRTTVTADISHLSALQSWASGYDVETNGVMSFDSVTGLYKEESSTITGSDLLNTQPLDNDLTQISNLSGFGGLLRRDADEGGYYWSLDTATYALIENIPSADSDQFIIAAQVFG